MGSMAALPPSAGGARIRFWTDDFELVYDNEGNTDR